MSQAKKQAAQKQPWSWHSVEAKFSLLRINEINAAKRRCRISNVIGKATK